ncbi:hypothetical protein [Streptomyces cavernicola]|uniref:HEAT repeat domain-containing protein n=1 Tax=Streptomyces cavernicola TaxID=3043613 RepID=A0ABT6SDX6_9ACTN|nr:hypothetical protein [Streptomyces sp. B-S-A6]MDI3406170.1 hypothetical protein [Streptomyces sp. B-S-A6]
MKIEPVLTKLVEDLESRVSAQVAASVEELAAHGDRVVPELLRGAADKNSTRLLQPYARVLELIGPPAFDAVLAAVRREELNGWLSGRLLGAFDERCAEQYAALAVEPDHSLSYAGFQGLIRLRVDSEAGLRALLDAFAREGRPSYKAEEYARTMHDSYAPRLRALRRDPTASRSVRRAALGVLMEVGGLDALDERDRTLVERLVRGKIPGEVPELPSPRLSGWWTAVPGATYEGVFDALGLHDPRPVTVAAGVAAAMGRTIRAPGSETPERAVGRVFVTPELDGWRLVFGQFDLLVGDDHFDGMIHTVERLSRACGRAQLFFLDDAGGADLWFVAEDGLVIRRYAAESVPEWEGTPLPWETLAVDDPDFDDEFDELDDVEPDAGTAGARAACGHLSVDPDLVGADTVVRGHGWLAVTAPNVGHGPFPGLLPV